MPTRPGSCGTPGSRRWTANISGRMKAAKEQIGKNELNKAQENQKNSIAELEKLVKNLEDRREAELDRLAKKLREGREEAGRAEGGAGKAGQEGQGRPAKPGRQTAGSGAETPVQAAAAAQQGRRRSWSSSCRGCGPTGPARPWARPAARWSKTASSCSGAKIPRTRKRPWTGSTRPSASCSAPASRPRRNCSANNCCASPTPSSGLKERQETLNAQATRIQNEVQQSKEWRRSLKVSLLQLGESEEGLGGETDTVGARS